MQYRICEAILWEPGPEPGHQVDQMRDEETQEDVEMTKVRNTMGVENLDGPLRHQEWEATRSKEGQEL